MTFFHDAFRNRSGGKRTSLSWKQRVFMLLLVGVLGFFTLIIIMAKLGRASASSDPNLDPLLNPNIRVGKNWCQAAIRSFILCYTTSASVQWEGKDPAVQRQPRRGSHLPNFKRVALFIFIRLLECPSSSPAGKKQTFFFEAFEVQTKQNKLWRGDQVQKNKSLFMLVCFVFGGQYNSFHWSFKLIFCRYWKKIWWVESDPNTGIIHWCFGGVPPTQTHTPPLWVLAWTLKTERFAFRLVIHTVSTCSCCFGLNGNITEMTYMCSHCVCNLHIIFRTMNRIHFQSNEATAGNLYSA